MPRPSRCAAWLTLLLVVTAAVVAGGVGTFTRGAGRPPGRHPDDHAELPVFAGSSGRMAS